jgi:hypothetical protein
MGQGTSLGEEIILDACCVISLFASGIPADILEALPCHFHVARYVYEHEALYTLTDPAINQREAIDLNPLIVRELIRVVDVSGAIEEATLVELATRVEAGEAATCTIAIHRGFTVASDERKVLQLLQQHAPPIRARTTTELIHWWAGVAALADDRVRPVLQAIRSRARFVPGKLDPYKGWWDRIIGST